MSLKKQNILFFSRTMQLGGTENVILQLCEIFKPLVNKIIVCSSGGVNVNELANMGIKHYTIPDIENKSLLNIIKTSAIIKRIIIEENITIVHTHHRMAAFYISLLSLYKKCVFVNTSHNTFKNKRFLTRYAYKHANIIACGNMVKKNLCEYYGLKNNQVSVIHNAVKSYNKEIVPDNLLKTFHDNGFFIVGNIGRLSAQKGMRYFIKAIPDIIAIYPKTRFVIVGTGEEEILLNNLATELNINDYLYFMGYRKDVQNVMKQLDLVVLSSLWEGLPLTPIEAFSVGKTIVATEVDGTLEIVDNEINGLLIKPKDSEAISNGIKYIIDNQDKVKMMEKKALEKYRNSFSFETFSKKYINYYLKVCNIIKVMK